MRSLSVPLILASNSPRRKELLADAGFLFDVEVIPTDESYPEDLHASEVAGYISEGKAEVFRGRYPDKLVLTADTVVITDTEILGKPKDFEDAFRMLRMLSGKTHEVITGVSLLRGEMLRTVSDRALVTFRHLEDAEIKYYIDTCKPYDKAGAYGVQEWISKIGIEHIEGSFFTIMGLPVHIVYQMLKPYMAS